MTPASATATNPAYVPPAFRPAPTAPAATVRISPAWWVPLHAFAVLAARLIYPLSVLAVAWSLVSLIIERGASAWFILAVLIVVLIALFAAPRDPEA